MDPRKKRIRRVQRLAEAAVPLKHFWEVPGSGRGKKLPRKQKVQSGNRSVYLVRRIARDRPDVLERMKAGEFETVRDAARTAGGIPPAPPGRMGPKQGAQSTATARCAAPRGSRGRWQPGRQAALTGPPTAALTAYLAMYLS
jgi:hypothetical protein